MFQMLGDLVFPPTRTPSPATPPPVDPGPASSCMTVGVPTASNYWLILGVVGAIALLTFLLIVLQNKKVKVR